VGGDLKHLLVTKTIVFCGYSLRDEDFIRIYKYLEKSMGEVMPHSYVVTLNDSATGKWKNKPTVIKTDATYFLSELKKRLVENNQLIPDSVLPEIISKLFPLKKIHFRLSRIDIKKDPLMILCLSYQDGIIHALERMEENWRSGYYSHLCNITNSIESYLSLKKSFLNKKRYFDVAYIDGYLTGLFLLLPELKGMDFPRYYIYGEDPLFDYSSYKRARKKSKRKFKSVYVWANKESKKYKKGMVLQHTPFLAGADIDA